MSDLSTMEYALHLDQTCNLKMIKHLGMWIPISKWVQAMDGKGMDLLLLIQARLQAQGIGAEIALD